MDRALKSRLLPLLWVGLVACPPLILAFEANASETETGDRRAHRRRPVDEDAPPLPLPAPPLSGTAGGGDGATLSAARLKQLSLSQLEQRLKEIDRQITRLSHFSLRGGVGAVGYRSNAHPEPAHAEWIQVELCEDARIDQIVLVPTIWREAKAGLRADGFPLEFRVMVGTSAHADGRVIAQYGPADGLLPRIAPLVINCPETTASWVRLEATTLSPRVWDGLHILQLSEIMIFSGQENVALQQTVQTSSTSHNVGEARHKHFLVDGFVPYLMDASQGEKSLAFASAVGDGVPTTLTVDLASTQPLNRVHLHAADLSDTIPQSTSNAYGLPKKLLIEGANHLDFSDAVRLLACQVDTIYDAGPIIMRRFPETSCRYVRFTILEPYIDETTFGSSPVVALAEIELFSHGKNVALGKSVSANFEVSSPERSLSTLTDGHNFYGEIPPVRIWINELAARHDLETERPIVVAELNRRYARQKANLTWMTWLAALLAAGIGCTLLIDRMVRKRQLAKIKNRFAADLHDELGANLHVIGLLGDLAQAAVDSPEKLKSLHQRIRVMTERTSTAVRYCTNMLKAKGLYEELPADMQRCTERIMADLEGEFSVQGEENLYRLKPRARADLFLFYKECLVNISRHSGATQFSARLTATPKELCLTVRDNGRGLADSPADGVPASLRRRARLLGARVTAQDPISGGTSITLKLRIRRWGFRR